MNLNKFLQNLNTLVENNPELGDLEVISVTDDSYQRVHFQESLGCYVSEGREFIYEEDFEDFRSEGYEDLNVNAICIN